MSQSQSSLDALPLELLEAITKDLQLKDLRNMRLVSKTWDVKVVSSISVLSHLHVELDEGTLSQLFSTVSNPVKAAAIKTLTVMAHAYDLSPIQHMLDVPRQEGEIATLGLVIGRVDIRKDDIRRVEESYSRMCTHNASFGMKGLEDRLKSILTLTPNLRCIKLEISSHINEHWRVEGQSASDLTLLGEVPWMAAAGILHALFESLSKAELFTLRELTIGCATPKCSIPLSALARVVPMLEKHDDMEKDANVRNILVNLEIFALCVKMDTEEELHATERELWYQPEWATRLQRRTPKVDQLASISGMLLPMLALQELDLHFYTPGLNHITSEATFSNIFDGIELTNLKKCTLRGVQCSEEVMANFLSAHSNVEELRLKCIQLKDWRMILIQIATMPHLQTVRFEWLHRGWNEVLNLTYPHEPDPEPRSPESFGDPNEFWDIWRHSRTFNGPVRGFNFSNGPTGLNSRVLGARYRTSLVKQYGEAWHGTYHR